jgi:hypothetical protein
MQRHGAAAWLTGVWLVACSASPPAAVVAVDAGAGDAAADGAAFEAGAPARDGGADAQSDAAAPLPTGTIVPLYTDPTDPSWSRLAAAAKAHPAVHVIAVVNPNNGPLPSVDPGYAKGIAALTAAGIRVAGYVATGYGARAQSATDGDVDLYRAQYPQLAGIFFDEAAIYEPGHEARYSAEASHARSAGFQLLVANPGTAPIAAYAGLFDVSLVYESAGVPASSTLSAFAASRTHAGIIPYGVPSLDAAYVAKIRPDVAYVFITDDGLPNPWDTLPPYFEALMSALE